MSKVKIFLSMFLILCLLASAAVLVGCNDDDGDENGEGAPAEEQQEGDNGEDGNGGEDEGDNGDEDNGDDGDDGAVDDDEDDADDDEDSDDSSTLTDLLGKATGIDGIQWEMTMTNYEDVEVSFTSNGWMEGNKWRSEFDTLITGEPTVWLHDYDEGVWYDWVVGEDTANKYDLSGTTEDAWGSQAGDEILDYSPTIVGTETIDGKTCTVIEYTETETNQECKGWVWNEHGITLKLEVRVAGQLTMKMEFNNVVVGDIDDSMFEVPAGMTIIDMTMPVV